MAPITLAEFRYRFNRCFALKVMLSRLGYAAVRTPAMPTPPQQSPSTTLDRYHNEARGVGKIKKPRLSSFLGHYRSGRSSGDFCVGVWSRALR